MDLESGERKLAFISLGGRSYHPLGIHISSVVEWPLFCVVLSHYAVRYSVLLILWPKLDTSSINRQVCEVSFGPMTFVLEFTLTTFADFGRFCDVLLKLDDRNLKGDL